MACTRNEWFRVVNGAGLACGWLGPYNIEIDRVPPLVSELACSVGMEHGGFNESMQRFIFVLRARLELSISDNLSGLASSSPGFTAEISCDRPRVLIYGEGLFGRLFTGSEDVEHSHDFRGTAVTIHCECSFSDYADNAGNVLASRSWSKDCEVMVR